MTTAPVRYYRPLHVMVVAGEASGDLLGAGLMKALQEQTGGTVHFSGVGGEAMTEAGLSSLFPMSDLSVMGLVEVLPRVRALAARLREAETHALASGPDAVVTIDSPGFNFRLGRRIARLGSPVIHYVAPSVWAWRPRRAARIAGFLDHLLALLPFEPPYFEAVGLPTTFVGHPAVEHGAGSGEGAAFRARHGIAGGVVVLMVLPGSRRSETSRLLPRFGSAVHRVAAEVPGLHAVVIAVPHLAASIDSAVTSWRVPVTVLDGPAEKFDAMAASDVALAASGTVSLELALSRVPAVVAYRAAPLTAAIVGPQLRVPYVSLVNLLIDRRVVPELLQGACNPPALAAAVLGLLRDAGARAEQLDAAATVAARLTPPGGSPSAVAAATVLRVIADAQSAA